jgi:hypothetical protein
MERNFTNENENFERFLRENADGLKMRPSARVWKSISGHLKRRRRRFGLILGTSLLLTTALGYYLINESAPENNTVTAKANDQTAQRPAKKQATAFRQPGVIEQANNAPEPIAQLTNAARQPLTANTNSGAGLPASDMEQPAFIPTVVDSYFPNSLGDEMSATGSDKTVTAADPLTIESILNSYKPRGKSKLGIQIYFTPTVSYRKLSDNNIDNVVTHKPDFGLELGVVAKYPISKNVKLRGGIQFNVNRYDIKTYSSYTQQATIRLYDRNRMTSLNTTTNYNNVSGYKSDWLQNLYFQVSAPVGVEVKLKGDDRVQFGIASTLQPTYILGDRAYLISSDYKNYAEVPKLIRHWNANTSFETFVAYSTGAVKWQVGPQVRYQLLSSFVKKYPVKENLFDFGLKVGLSLNQ